MFSAKRCVDGIQQAPYRTKAGRKPGLRVINDRFRRLVIHVEAEVLAGRCLRDRRGRLRSVPDNLELRG